MQSVSKLFVCVARVLVSWLKVVVVMSVMYVSVCVLFIVACSSMSFMTVSAQVPMRP